MAAVPLLVAGGALAAKVTTRSEVTALPAAAAGTAIAGCPPGAKATGGGARPSSPDDYLTGSAPVAKREWLAAGWGGEGNAFTAYARCVGGAELVTRSRTAVLPSGGEGAAVTARCPRGTQVAGGGARLGDDYEDYLIGSHPSGRRAWTAVGWRPGYPTPSTVTAFARCLKGAKLTTRRRTTPVPPANELRAARARWGGFRLAIPDGDYARGSFPAGGRAWVARASRGEVGPASSSLTAFVRCLKR